MLGAPYDSSHLYYKCTAPNCSQSSYNKYHWVMILNWGMRILWDFKNIQRKVVCFLDDNNTSTPNISNKCFHQENISYTYFLKPTPAWEFWLGLVMAVTGCWRRELTGRNSLYEVIAICNISHMTGYYKWEFVIRDRTKLRMEQQNREICLSSIALWIGHIMGWDSMTERCIIWNNGSYLTATY